jgi:hypothetical protein
MKLWKVVGLAGLAGVAATGVIIARDQRQRAQLAPDDVRARLHERLEQAGSAGDPVTTPAAPSAGSAGRHAARRSDLWARLRAAVTSDEHVCG